jgi:redox-sensitive bicupin YhaK (pirin superfamily)
MKKSIEIRRSGDRFLTRTHWLNSKHSFSFGTHYDPNNTEFGLLVVSNDDIVKAGTGFSTHPHRDMEIVTWVLDGELEHKDSQGNRGTIVPGDAQRMSAGRGILHSEMNYSAVTPVHFIQMWVLPDEENLDPGYEQTNVGNLLNSGELFPIASGRGHDGAVRIHQKDATLWGARLKPGKSIALPDAFQSHLYVAKGSIQIEDAGTLNTGDAARMTSAGIRRITANSNSDTEVLLWQFQI